LSIEAPADTTSVHVPFAAIVWGSVPSIADWLTVTPVVVHVPMPPVAVTEPVRVAPATETG
jgi:hypothetical protein